jgi:hypothetical protein
MTEIRPREEDNPVIARRHQEHRLPTRPSENGKLRLFLETRLRPSKDPMSSTYLLHPRSSRLDHFDSSKRDSFLLPVSTAVVRHQESKKLERHPNLRGPARFSRVWCRRHFLPTVLIGYWQWSCRPRACRSPYTFYTGTRSKCIWPNELLYSLKSILFPIISSRTPPPHL